ncbi:hypothetical protein [Wolbachia endosymbiont (group B) of Aricia artaxerxes]
MKSLLVERNRTVILLLIVIFTFGSYTYIKMPRESNPDRLCCIALIGM